jgi:hypothetical protein
LANLRCDECGELFQIPYSTLRSRINKGYSNIYCSTFCRSRAVGKNYGFIAHPENRLNNNSSKWQEQIPQITEMLKQGYYLNAILISLGIPRGSHGQIKKMMAKISAHIST